MILQAHNVLFKRDERVYKLGSTPNSNYPGGALLIIFKSLGTSSCLGHAFHELLE